MWQLPFSIGNPLNFFRKDEIFTPSRAYYD